MGIVKRDIISRIEDIFDEMAKLRSKIIREIAKSDENKIEFMTGNIQFVMINDDNELDYYVADYLTLHENKIFVAATEKNDTTRHYFEFTDLILDDQFALLMSIANKL